MKDFLEEGDAIEVKQVAPKKSETSALNPLALAQNVAQGASFGFADEIGQGAALALSPLVYGGNQALNLAGLGSENLANMDYGQFLDNILNSKQAVMQPMNEYNSEHPLAAVAAQVAGGIGGGTALAKLGGALFPNAAKAVQSFAQSSPYLTAAGTGAGVGAVYGAGTGDETSQGRGGNALAQGSIGLLAGPLATLGINKAVAPAAGYVGKKLGALAEYFTPKSATVNPPQPIPPAAPISTITNEPLGAPPSPKAVGPATMTGKLALSPGVKAKDSNLLRIEEDARQGLLGREAESQIKASDAGVFQDARRAMQQLKGVTNADSDEILSKNVKVFQDEAAKVKSTVQALYKERDTMLADTVVNKRKVAPSLGASLSDAVNDPQTISAFKSKAGKEAMSLYDDYKTLVTSGDNELPMVDLTAWRQDVAALAVEKQGTPAGVAAAKLGRAYDNWMDEAFDQSMVLKGDANVAAKAAEASKGWREYKTLFGSDSSSVIEGMTKPFDLTPRDFVDKVFGANISGNGSTALNVRKMVNALPAEAQGQFKEGVFQGLVSRVFEGANHADNLKLGALRDNLIKLKDSQVYKEHFASDKAKDVVINNLINDLNQHITQTGRRDVMSPSGGHIMRGMKALVGGLAETPVVNKIPGVKVADTAVNKLADASQASMDLKTFRNEMRKMMMEANQNGKKGKVFEIDALKAGITGSSMVNAAREKK